MSIKILYHTLAFAILQNLEDKMNFFQGETIFHPDQNPGSIILSATFGIEQLWEAHGLSYL